MRAPLLIGLLAVALGASACAPTPTPTVFGDGMITEITSPGEGADLLAVGPQGEALVRYSAGPEDQDGLPGAAVALVYRDGSRDVIAEKPRDELDPAQAQVSDTTVAWLDYSPSSGERFLTFWDRHTHRLSRSSDVTTMGEYLDLNATPRSWLTAMVLVGDTAYWLSLKDRVLAEHYDSLASDDYYDHNAILASSSDGRTSLLLGPDDKWVGLGIDECASTPDRPVLWGVRVLERSHSGNPSSLESVQIDVTDPHHAILIEGSGIPFSALDPYYIPSSRCGNDFVTLAGDLDREHSDYLGLITLASPDHISLLDVPEFDFQVESVVLTPEWIGITHGTFNYSAGAGGGPEPGQWSLALPALGGAPLPTLVTWLVHRDTGKVYAFGPSDYRGPVYMGGEFIAWEVPEGTGPYVGVLTPPMG